MSTMVDKPEVHRRRTRIRRLGESAFLTNPSLIQTTNDILRPSTNNVNGELNEKAKIVSQDGRDHNPWYSTIATATSAVTKREAGDMGADSDVGYNNWWPSEKLRSDYYSGTYVSSSFGVWDYYAFLYSLLFLWILYLILPRGCRRRWCNAIPRRYARTKWKTGLGSNLYHEGTGQSSISEFGPPPGADSSFTSHSFFTGSSSAGTKYSNWMEAEERRMRERQILAREMLEGREDGRNLSSFQRQQQLGGSREKSPKERISDANLGGIYSSGIKKADNHDKYDTSYSTMSVHESSSQPFSDILADASGVQNSMGMIFGVPQPVVPKPPPSPEHPGIPRLPPPKILNETMERLRKRGVRLIAHGVQCEPKRVWIRLDDETTSVSWQTEYPRRIVNQSGEASIVLMRGALHRIALPNVLYVDVGKKTNALMRHENRSIPDSVCFSLLTQNGSLDLQTNSKLERDALVSCISLVLDHVHTEDWRNLYDESPATSQAMSSTRDTWSFSQIPSDMVEI